MANDTTLRRSTTATAAPQRSAEYVPPVAGEAEDSPAPESYEEQRRRAMASLAALSTIAGEASNLKRSRGASGASSPGTVGDMGSVPGRGIRV